MVSSDITLTPATATEAVGTNHTVTATVAKDGSPLAGAVVSFTVSAGPNTGKTGTCTTAANGQCTFTYHDDGGAGTDTILGEFTNNGVTQQASASVTWGGTAPPTLTLTPPSANRTTGTDHTVTATVLNGDGSALPGGVVNFTVPAGPNSGKTGTCTTAATGQCDFTYHDDGGAGTDTIHGDYASSSGTLEASATVTWTTPPPPPGKPTKLVAEPTVARVVLDATTGRTYLTLAATLTTLDGVGVPYKTIEMSSGGVLCVTRTNAQGFATCGGLIPAVQATLNGNYWATFFGDAQYYGSSSKGPILTVAGLRIES